MVKCKLRKNLLTVFVYALVWLIIVYCMKGCVTCYIYIYIYIYIKELWVYVTHQILQQPTCHNHVLNYMSVQNLAHSWGDVH